jgi:hypothetical protein
MLDHHDARADPPIDGGCPRCGSLRMTFAVERSARWGLLRVERCVVRECGDCGARWAEPIIGSAPEALGLPGVFRRPVS